MGPAGAELHHRPAPGGPDDAVVGERLITARSEPVFGGVYKLVAYEDEQGQVILEAPGR